MLILIYISLKEECNEKNRLLSHALYLNNGPKTNFTIFCTILRQKKVNCQNVKSVY